MVLTVGYLICSVTAFCLISTFGQKNLKGKDFELSILDILFCVITASLGPLALGAILIAWLVVWSDYVLDESHKGVE